MPFIEEERSSTIIISTSRRPAVAATLMVEYCWFNTRKKYRGACTVAFTVTVR